MNFWWDANYAHTYILLICPLIWFIWKLLFRESSVSCDNLESVEALNSTNFGISSEVLWSWRFSFRGCHLQSFIAWERALRKIFNCQTDIWATEEFFAIFFHQNAFQAGKWMKKSIKNALKVYISLLPTNSYDKQLLESKKLWLQFSCQICPLCLLPAWSRDVAEDALQGQAKKLVGEVKNYDCY